MSRLRSILRRNQLNGMQAPETKAEQVADALQVNDGLEFAARVALAGYDTIKDQLPMNKEYRLGYRTALAVQAVVLRAMRRGSPPDMAELAEVRREAVRLVDEEFDDVG